MSRADPRDVHSAAAGKSVDTIKEIHAELSGINHLFQIAVGSADQAKLGKLRFDRFAKPP